MPPFLLDPYFDVTVLLVALVPTISGWLDLRQARAAVSWPTAPGRIVTRSIDEASFDGRYSYLPILAYRYTVDDATYEGVRLSFRTYWSRQGAMTAAYHYSPGQHVTVHYNPAAPDRSVLTLESDDRPYLALTLGLTGILLALGALLWAA